ncbi:MAG TPA: GWxTD domain-containing protein [Balneolales bacterium]|nr:GWxTD domain-containing protein [Balneolales bacterium]
MGKTTALFTRAASFVALLVVIFLGGCTTPRYANVSAGDLHSFVPGLPNFNIGAFGFYDEHYLPGLRVDISIPYNSLIFKSVNNTGRFEAHFDMELKITRKDTADALPIVKSYNRTIDVSNYSASRSLKNYLIHFKTILVPGTYDIQAVLLDQNSGKSSQQSLHSIIPNPAQNQVTTTSIELLSKGGGPDAPPNFEPVLTYHISQSVDSLKAAIQLYLNTTNNNLNLKMALVKFRADSTPARPPYFVTPMQGSLEYRGIDFGTADTIQVTTRNYNGLAGAISIDFLLPKLKQGIYRASIIGTDAANNTSFVRSRDFAVREPGFPRLTNLNELAEATYYIATQKEYKNLMRYYNSDSLKQAFDKFWANLIPNKHKAKAVISSYYSRVEDANMLFSNYKEGWKTDPGMLYIVLGPPSYVEHNIDGMTWYYQQFTSDVPNTFYFKQVINTRDFFPFNHYLLMRNIYYQQVYYTRVEDWRDGIVP